MTQLIQSAIHQLAEGMSLSEAQAEEVMLEIMRGEATDSQIAAYLMGLRMKGETVEEITGSAKAMRSLAEKILLRETLIVDTCGTGGDRSGTFNISTASAFVIAGGGITVAKHGNRSVSSKSGSADVLSALGVAINLPSHKVADCINEVGIGFLFAPLYHGAMKYCAKPRTEMGIRTIMNILGPLSNPAGANIHILGVYDKALTKILAEVLIRLGTRHCFVIHGKDGLDEITLTTSTAVAEGKEGLVSCYEIEPRDFGLKPVPLSAFQGGSPQDNAAIIQDILRGRQGPQREIVLINAAPAFVACEKAATLQEGYQLAAQAIDTGEAWKKLEQLITFTTTAAS